jgi:hypothetical protein
MERLQNRNTDLLNEISQWESELQPLLEDSQNERAAIDQQTSTFRAERERIAALEYEVDQDALRQVSEEIELEIIEDELETRKTDAESKRKALLIRQTAANQMLDQYQQNLIAA